MEDLLQPIRRLYGETPERHDPRPEPRGEAEERMLAPVKEALEQLPPVTPDPSTVEAVLAAAGAHAVRHLYDEAPPESLSAAAQNEARALAPVVRALEALPPERPDPSVLATVVAAATPTRPSRADRAAVPATRARRRRRPVALLGGLFVLFLVAGSLLFVNQDAGQDVVLATEMSATVPTPDFEPEPVADEPAPIDETAPQVAMAATAAEEATAARTAPPVEDLPALQLTASGFAVENAAAEAEASGAALRLLYLRLEAMQDDDLDWDEPVELGEPQPETTPSRGWMQVRVDR